VFIRDFFGVQKKNQKGILSSLEKARENENEEEKAREKVK
jgi:hypothetical protein